MTDYVFGIVTVLVLEGVAVGLWFGGKALWAKVVAALKAEVAKL